MRTLHVMVGSGVVLLLTACGAGSSTGGGSSTVTPDLSTRTSSAAPSQVPPSSPVPSNLTPSPVAEAVVTLSEPQDGAQVHQCEVFQGTAQLPPTRTIVLGMRNLDNHDPTRYFEMVDNWEYPKDLKDWKGYQWFGSKNSSVGQRYRVEVLTVDLAEAKQKTGTAKTSWTGTDNPITSEVAAHITVKRVAGAGPKECS